jgi:stress-induced morphogen
MAILKKVQSLLEAAFPPPDKIRLEEDEKIIGTITSQRFDGMETIDRINMVWDILDGGLTSEERRQILMIVPATPEEEIAYTA